MSPKTSDSGTATDGGGGPATPVRITAFALALFLLVVGCQNTAATTLRLPVGEVTLPLWTVLLAAGLVGALGGAAAQRRRGRRDVP